MTRRKPTDDLRESISQTVADPERAAPTFGEPTGSSETVLLASYAAAIRQNDEAEMCVVPESCSSARIFVKLHQISLQEHDKLSREAAGLVAARAEVARLQSVLRRLMYLRPASIEQSEAIARDLQEAEKLLPAAQTAESLCVIAAAKSRCLEIWAGPLFGRPEARNGAVLHADLKTDVHCEEQLGIPSGAPGAWRRAPPQRAARQTRRLVAAMAAAKNRPAFR